MYVGCKTDHTIFENAHLQHPGTGFRRRLVQRGWPGLVGKCLDALLGGVPALVSD